MKDGLSAAGKAAAKALGEVAARLKKTREEAAKTEAQFAASWLKNLDTRGSLLGNDRILKDRAFADGLRRNAFSSEQVRDRNPHLRPFERTNIWGDSREKKAPLEFDFKNSKIGQSLTKAIQREWVRNPKMVEGLAKYGQYLPQIAGFAASAASAIASVGIAAAKLYAAFVGLSAAAAMAFGNMVRDAQKVRGDALYAWDALLKGPAAAEAAYKRAASLGVRLGQDFKESIGGFGQLLARGFSTDEAEQALRAAADMSVLAPTMDTSRVITALAQIKSKGRLQMEELQGQLGEAWDVGAVVAELSKQLGKTPDEVRKQITAGKVTAEQGLNAFYASVRAKTGKELGQLAEGKAGRTLEGLWARAKNLGQQLLSTAKVNWSPLEGALKNLSKFLESPAAERGLKRITDAFNGVLEAVFGDLAGADGPQKMETILNGVAGAAETMASSLKSAAGAASTILSLFERIDKITNNKGTMNAVKATISAAINGLMGLALGPLGFIGGLLWDIGKAISELTGSASGFGAAIKSAAVVALGPLAWVANAVWDIVTAIDALIAKIPSLGQIPGTFADLLSGERSLFVDEDAERAKRMNEPTYKGTLEPRTQDPAYVAGQKIAQNVTNNSQTDARKNIQVSQTFTQPTDPGTALASVLAGLNGA